MLGNFLNSPVTIIKLGGSLFDMPDLKSRLLRFLGEQAFARPVIIPGGGRFANEVRRVDELLDLGDDLAHELGVQTLSLTARLVAGLSPRLQLATSPDQLSSIWEADLLPVLDVAELTLQQSPLPASWDVTSDSIAAWVCSLREESQLVLVKSVPLIGSLSLSEAAKLGLVDAYFPVAASGLQHLSWCNLRDAAPHLKKWSP